MASLRLHNVKRFYDWLEAPTFADYLHVGHNILTRINPNEFSEVLKTLGDYSRFGFTCSNSFQEEGAKKSWKMFDWWAKVSSMGFSDYSHPLDAWIHPFKNYSANDRFDWVSKTTNIGELHPQVVYSNVLGSPWDTVRTLLAPFKYVDGVTFVEIMAGSAEASWWGHWEFPNVRYHMIDIDPEAKTFALVNHRWLPNVNMEYVVGDATDPASYPKAAKGLRIGFIGKSSLSMLTPRQAEDLMRVALSKLDVLIYESVFSTLRTLEDKTDLTHPALKRRGLQTVLENTVDVNLLNDSTGFALRTYQAVGKKQVKTDFISYDWRVFGTHDFIRAAERVSNARWDVYYQKPDRTTASSIERRDVKLYPLDTFKPRYCDNEQLCVFLINNGRVPL